jgi:hypothetical protein
MKKEKQAKMTPEMKDHILGKDAIGRRAFFKKIAGISLGATAGVATPHKAIASDCFVPDFDAALGMVITEVFDYFTAGYFSDFADYMGDYAVFVGENSQKGSETLGTATAKLGDAVNQTQVTLEEEKLKRNTRPAPHECGSKALGESIKELVDAAKTSLKKMVGEFNTLSNASSVKPNYQRIKKNKARVKKIIDEGRSDAIEAANFYSDRGYADIEVANEVLESLMGNVAIVPEYNDDIAIRRRGSKEGLRFIAARDAHNAATNLVYDNLAYIMTRRVPSVKVKDFLSSNSEPDIKAIMQAKSFTSGMSLVDLEQLEIDITYFNEVWRQQIRGDYAADTPMLEELNKLQSFNNYLENTSNQIKERNNQLLGLKQILLMRAKDANG